MRSASSSRILEGFYGVSCREYRQGKAPLVRRARTRISPSRRAAAYLIRLTYVETWLQMQMPSPRVDYWRPPRPPVMKPSSAASVQTLAGVLVSPTSDTGDL